MEHTAKPNARDIGIAEQTEDSLIIRLQYSARYLSAVDGDGYGVALQRQDDLVPFAGLQGNGFCALQRRGAFGRSSSAIVLRVGQPMQLHALGT